jgi:AcrR family transcriptional regulator
MAQIATASGIAVGQIYRDFANKEAIIAAICEADIAGWLEEEVLEAAVAAKDSHAIHAWIERIATEEPSESDRRLMCELLAEVGRNPMIAELNYRAEIRLRASLEAALVSLAPAESPQHRATMTDFIISISWGMVAGIELFPYRDHEALRRYVAKLLRKEVAALEA